MNCLLLKDYNLQLNWMAFKNLLIFNKTTIEKDNFELLDIVFNNIKLFNDGFAS